MPDHIVTVFRSRLRPGAADQYEATAAAIERRARHTPGFVEFKTYTAEDGERLSLIVFDSRSTHNAWRDDPEHREAQRLGREQYYECYDIQVCQLLEHRQHTPDFLGD